MKRTPRWHAGRGQRLLLVSALLLTLLALLSACSVTGGDDDEDTDDSATPVVDVTSTADTSRATATSVADAQGTPGPASTPVTGIDEPATPVVTVSDVLADPQAFIDLPITLDADVATIVDDLAVTIVDTGTASPLLVVGAPGVIPTDLDAGAYVRVSGVVRTFEQSEIELAIGAGLDDDAVADFAGEPVIVANAVHIGLVSVDGLLADPEAYLDRRVTVTGPIGQIISPQSFTLASEVDGDELLVAAPFRAIAPGIAADKWVRATGTVRQPDPEDEVFSDELAFLFDDDAYAAFIDQPIVVLDLLEILSDDTTTTTGEILADPASFGAQQVIVSGSVSATLSALAFTLDADGQPLLVVAREGTIPADFSAGAVVLVSGIVDTFSVSGTDAIVWQALGVNPTDANLAKFDGQPAIIADRIDLVAVANGP